jgi:hypothetical protein
MAGPVDILEVVIILRMLIGISDDDGQGSSQGLPFVEAGKNFGDVFFIP